ncbi:mannosyl phosphorylinositol ceramide synthase [Anaeramoeba flamelloides]|uniref:Mannosyl phosphorylinositol ceramide synthase n=1 Tax=Anaeramoeba flamelloides TaxID=1746091 RepID=A0ABQ8Z0L2_9EUKA|nr:mannosyl phosphorylinositol ceramide synthase [Anaeramoeba flamelloides]
MIRNKITPNKNIKKYLIALGIFVLILFFVLHQPHNKNQIQRIEPNRVTQNLYFNFTQQACQKHYYRQLSHLKRTEGFGNFGRDEQNLCDRWTGTTIDTTSRIPKRIFQIIKNKNDIGDRKKWIDTCRKLNPNYEYFLFDDNDLEILLHLFGTKDEIENYMNINSGVTKSDFMRIFVMYYFGGIYIDTDIKCFASFDQWISPKDDVVFGTEWYYHFQDFVRICQQTQIWVPTHQNVGGYTNWFFASRPHENIFKLFLNEFVKNLKEHKTKKIKYDVDPLFFGPHLIKRVLKDYLDENREQLENWVFLDLDNSGESKGRQCPGTLRVMKHCYAGRKKGGWRKVAKKKIQFLKNYD